MQPPRNLAASPISSEGTMCEELLAALATLAELSREEQERRKQALLQERPEWAGEVESFLANHCQMLALAKCGASELAGEAPTLAPAPPSADRNPADQALELPPQAAAIFGGYELLGEIARGGMGVVYKARQVKLNRTVALKMILQGSLASEQDVQRFYAEAEAAAALNHPGIVPIYEVGEREGRHFFAMRFIEGQSLAARIAEGPLPPREAASLMKKVAEGISYAHEREVIHRDLKPGNILIDRAGEPQITDFGLAKRMGSGSDLTATGQVMGTPSYMPPEQAAGKKHEINERSDIYSLGAILYAMLTGRPPFQAESPFDTLLQVLESEPTLPSKVNRQAPHELELICMRCLEKNPAHRYASALDVARDLERFLKDEPVEARPSGLWRRVRRWVRREPALASHWGALAAMATVITAIFFTLGSDWAYYLRHMETLAAWAVASYAFQQMLNAPRREALARYLWATADALLLTLTLYLTDGGIAALLVLYSLLIACSGLFFRVSLVVYTTAVTIACFAALVAARPEMLDPPYYAIHVVVVQAVLGMAVANQAHRVRALSRYYEGRPLP